MMASKTPIDLLNPHPSSDTKKYCSVVTEFTINIDELMKYANGNNNVC